MAKLTEQDLQNFNSMDTVQRNFISLYHSYCKQVNNIFTNYYAWEDPVEELKDIRADVISMATAFEGTTGDWKMIHNLFGELILRIEELIIFLGKEFDKKEEATEDGAENERTEIRPTTFVAAIQELHKANENESKLRKNIREIVDELKGCKEGLREKPENSSAKVEYIRELAIEHARTLQYLWKAIKGVSFLGEEEKALETLKEEFRQMIHEADKYR